MVTLILCASCYLKVNHIEWKYTRRYWISQQKHQDLLQYCGKPVFELVSRDSPPDCHIQFFKSVVLLKQKSPTANAVGLFWQMAIIRIQNRNKDLRWTPLCTEGFTSVLGGSFPACPSTSWTTTPSRSSVNLSLPFIATSNALPPYLFMRSCAYFGWM